MIDIVKEKTGVDFNEIETDEQAQEAARKAGIEIDPIKTTRGAGVKTCSSFCIYSVFLLGDIGNNGCANSVFAVALYGVGEGK